ncbi:hypothetical protein FXO38_00362 [Capsicum annuum]|nr:hypothetical protein FXO38_00362 [Capsicum annuum]
MKVITLSYSYFVALHGDAAVYAMFSVWFREYGPQFTKTVPVSEVKESENMEKVVPLKTAGQYTVPPPPPPLPVTTTLHPTTTNIPPPPTCTISLLNAFFMPPPSDQFHTSSSQNSLHSSSSSVPSTSPAPSLSGLRVGDTSTFIQVNLQNGEILTSTLYNDVEEKKFLNGGVDVPLPTAFTETHMKKNLDDTRAEWVEPRAKDAFEGFQKSIEDWRQTQPASEDGTMVQPSLTDMSRIWTTVVGGPKKGKTYGIGVYQSSSSSSPMLPNSSSISQNVEEMEAMRTKIEELTQHCAKFVKFEALVKKHML